jgi:tRNA pseudouridine55 synthase
MKSEQSILNLYKKPGETPLACMERFRMLNPEYAGVPMTYAGRLDPMAEGVLIVLTGKIKEATKKELLAFDKVYEFEVLWGFETDTFDALGLVTQVGKEPLRNFDKKIDRLLRDVQKKKTQTYPPYSSRTVGGKSLFTYAREGRLDEIDIPTKQIHIFSLEHIHTRHISQKKLLSEIEENISKVVGDFRQAEILETWNRSISAEGDALISMCRAVVTSGTYVRSIAKELGDRMESGALAYSIKRTRVGPHQIEDSVQF